MSDVPPDPPQDLDDELEDHADELADLDTEIRNLLESFREESDAALRIAARYTADETDVLFVRPDVAEQYAPPELDDQVEALIMKGLGDPPQEDILRDFGELDATVRWYDTTVVVHFPYREWSGLLFVFDRYDSPLIDLMGDHLGDD